MLSKVTVENPAIYCIVASGNKGALKFSANQWTGFYMITTSVMKGLITKEAMGLLC